MTSYELEILKTWNLLASRVILGYENCLSWDTHSPLTSQNWSIQQFQSSSKRDMRQGQTYPVS